MYSEVFQWDRSSNVSNMTKLVFTDAGGRAAHAFRVTLLCEETCRQQHKDITARKVQTAHCEDL